MIRIEAATIVEALAAAFREGVPAGDPRAIALAERHRQHIDRWYYPCDRQVHLTLSLRVGSTLCREFRDSGCAMWFFCSGQGSHH